MKVATQFPGFKVVSVEPDTVQNFFEAFETVIDTFALLETTLTPT